MFVFPLHPATRLLVWLNLLIAVQCLSGEALLVALGIFPFLGKRVLRRGGKLVWRTRWLMLSLWVIFAWGTAGEPLWDAAQAPTREGLREAMTHLGRLALVLMAVAVLLEKMSLSDLLAATHTVLAPFERLGLNPDRGVVRLLLTLRYAENLPRPRDWKNLLTVPETPAEEIVEVRAMPFGWRDLAVAMPFVGLVGYYGFA